MPEQKIPCIDCEAKREEIEATGRYRVTGCTPIPDKDDWCIIQYEVVNTGSNIAMQESPAD